MNNKTPKYKIGDIVQATWSSGNTTIHTIISIEEALHGFWCNWIEKDGNTSGLYEHHLSKVESK